ncbi:ABC-type Fe3+-siderophore transport system permease subunit [Paenibacillus sp. V4I7]|nr:ABC-type Fe3+-siderophore transport system permease subunit [Paenibacillus sp. V4I7]
MMVVLADLIARTAFMPHDIPVGVFTAGVGAPFFIICFIDIQQHENQLNKDETK